jgi:hypothetical protein
MKSIMIYGHDRCGTTTLMHCLAKNRVILGEFLTESYLDCHYVKSMVTMNMNYKEFKIKNTDALSAIMKSNTIIAKCHLHWAQPEYFIFDGIKIWIHRKDIVDAQLSKQIAIHTKIWNSNVLPEIQPFSIDADEFIQGIESRLSDTYIDQSMDYVLDYDIDLPYIIEHSNYRLLKNSNKKLYNNKSKIVTNYEFLLDKASQYSHDIENINRKFQTKRTGFDTNLEYEKWTNTDNIDFYR